MAETARPWLIVHRAGHNRQRLATAIQSPADYLEIDVRGDGPQLESRHDPLFHSKLPFLTNWYGLPRLNLRLLPLREIHAPRRLYLDFKDRDPAVVERTVAILRSNGNLEGAVASASHWAMLDRLAEIAPDVGRYYAVPPRRLDRHAVWRAYARRLAEGRGGDGTAIHAGLASAERLQTVRAAGLRAICYKVTDFETGIRLLAAGAGGLTSHRLDLIERWRDRLEGAAG